MGKRRIIIRATLDNEKYCNGCPCDQNDEGLLYCSAIRGEAGDNFLHEITLPNGLGGFRGWRVRSIICPAKKLTRKSKRDWAERMTDAIIKKRDKKPALTPGAGEKCCKDGEG